MPIFKAGGHLARLSRIGAPTKAAIASFAWSVAVSWFASKPEYRDQLTAIILQVRGWVDAVFQLFADMLNLGEPYATISSAMPSVGVLQPRVFLGRPLLRAARR